MGRLIELDAAIKATWKDTGYTDPLNVMTAIRDRLEALPTVDAVPVRHGRWIYHIDDLFPAESTQECDQCHEEQPLTCGDNFCPNCGAKMTGKGGDNHD